MYIVGPFTPSRGIRFVVTLIDRRTRWPEAIPTNDISAKTIANIIACDWVSRFGCPAVILTDQGRQFQSDLVSKLSELLGTHKVQTTAYDPQCNGRIERWHSSLKAALKTYRTDDWVPILLFILLGLRIATNDDTGVSAAQLTYEADLRSPGEFFMDGHAKPIDNALEFVRNLSRALRKIRQPRLVIVRMSLYVSILIAARYSPLTQVRIVF